MLIYFCRHGQTEYNAQGIIQGNIDVHLNEQGQMEAALLAEGLKTVPFTEARSSHLTRAFEAVVNKHAGLELVPDPGLRERQLGSLEGKRWTPKDGIPADAEQSAAFRARVKEWAEGFFASHVPSGTTNTTNPSAPEPTVLAVSHGAYLSALLGALLSPPFSFAVAHGVDTHKPCLNTSVMRVRANYRDGKWRGEIQSWGNVDHMGGREQRLGVSDDIRAQFRKAMGMGTTQAGEGAEEKATEEEAHPSGVQVKA